MVPVEYTADVIKGRGQSTGSGEYVFEHLDSFRSEVLPVLDSSFPRAEYGIEIVVVSHAEDELRKHRDLCMGINVEHVEADCVIIL